MGDPPIEIGGYKMLYVGSVGILNKKSRNVSEIQLFKSFSLDANFDKHCGKRRLYDEVNSIF